MAAAPPFVIDPTKPVLPSALVKMVKPAFDSFSLPPTKSRSASVLMM
jgi:hypothetical protein